MPIELKPCPFCGVTPDCIEGYEDYDNAYFFVRCMNPDCKVGPEADCGYESPEEAAGAWNTRAE